MAKAKSRKPLVKYDWREIVRMWSVQASAITAGASGWYAATESAKDLISPTQFASAIAAANLLVIILRSLNQTEVPK